MLNITAIVNQIKHEFERILPKIDDGHEFDHVLRVMNNAMYLQKIEGGNRKIIVFAALLHDVHRWMQLRENRYFEPIESLPLVDLILTNVQLLNDQEKTMVMDIIANHEHYQIEDDMSSKTSIELKILQDADKLDAIGAIGIFRTIKYGIAHNICDYDDTIPLYRVPEYSSNKDDISTIHHLYNKLLRVDTMLWTDAAKKLSISRTVLLKNFLDSYIEEWSISHHGED